MRSLVDMGTGLDGLDLIKKVEKRFALDYTFAERSHSLKWKNLAITLKA